MGYFIASLPFLPPLRTGSMISFGRKCPACGSRRVVAASGSARARAFPLARRCACADCGQQMVCLPGLSRTIEHRHHPRQRLPPFFLVRLPGQTTRFARIRDLSEGGICFVSPAGQTPPPGRFLLDLYNCNDGSSLELLSAEIVATRESHLDSDGVSTTVINSCARFTSLNRAQKKVLRACIARYGTV